MCIYVDESGDTSLSLQSDLYYTLGFVYCKDSEMLTSNLLLYLRYAHKINIYPRCLNELKFNLPIYRLKKNYSNDEIDCFKKSIFDIRNNVLEIINHHSDGIFITIVCFVT